MDCDQDACWICLAPATAEEPLGMPCACPRPVHAACLARWQLHSAGTSEETACRFCHSALPDWKGVLTPAEAELAGGMPYVAPTMSVTFNGQVHHVQVRGGPGGYEAFIGDIRRIFGIGPDAEMALAFDCADPVTGALVKLNGAGAYQAAVHCAAVSAAKRLAGWAREQRAAAAEAAAARLPSEEWPALPAATTAAPATPAQGLQRVSERGCSTDSEVGTTVEDLLAAAAAPTTTAPAVAAPPPSADSSRPDDVRRALAHMAASLKRLHAAAAAAAAAADAAGRAASAAGPAGPATPAADLQRATAAAGVDPAALRSLQARVAGLLRAMPRGRGSGSAMGGLLTDMPLRRASAVGGPDDAE